MSLLGRKKKYLSPCALEKKRLFRPEKTLPLLFTVAKLPEAPEDNPEEVGVGGSGEAGEADKSAANKPAPHKSDKG